MFLKSNKKIDMKNTLIKISDNVNRVGIKNANGIKELNGVWPFVDENMNFINVIAVGNKNGIDDKIDLTSLKSMFPESKFVYNCQNGPYLISHYDEILDNFDGHMTLDYDRSNSKSLYMNHSMMVRSMPFSGLFWEPNKEKKWDFSILTDIGNNISKMWDSCVEISDGLCSSGFKGSLVTQRHDFSRITSFPRGRNFIKFVRGRDRKSVV